MTASRSISQRIDKAPTILDVAAAAGVSKSTVSNVVRGAPEVSARTRRRVLEGLALGILGDPPHVAALPYRTGEAQHGPRSCSVPTYHNDLRDLNDLNQAALARYFQ